MALGVTFTYSDIVDTGLGRRLSKESACPVWFKLSMWQNLESSRREASGYPCEELFYLKVGRTILKVSGTIF